VGEPRVALGLDGCAAGWVAVRLEDGAVADVQVVAHAVAALTGVDAAGVDIPIGLLDVADRDADVAARRLLGRRASSVFRTPPRAVAELLRRDPGADHVVASALAVERTGRGISVQAFRLLPRIVEIDALIADAPLAEVHPEVAFAVLRDAPLPRKTSWAGLEARRAALADVGIELPRAFRGADRCAPDDVVDAAVCAYVADGLAGAGPTLTVPDHTSQRDHGRPVVIHARPAQPTAGGRRTTA
jgi:predicted RNase H-like nuclease